jgi:hypothetical protein
VIPERFARDQKNLTSIVWPETLEIIGANAFSKTGLTELVLPEGVKTIGGAAFSGCENLTSVTIPGSIEAIGMYAFAYCPVLAKVTVPAHTIKYNTGPHDGKGPEYGAFINCPKLTSIAARKAITDTGYTGDF